MKQLRSILALVAFLFLAAGYGASQFAYFTGTPSEFAARMDAMPIRLLAAVLFVSALVLCFIRSGEPEEN
jgi:hypothetical protein